MSVVLYGSVMLCQGMWDVGSVGDGGSGGVGVGGGGGEGSQRNNVRSIRFS